MKALVTGAAGFIGSNLVEALVTRGDTVRGLDNLATGRLDNLKCVQGNSNFEFMKVDLRDDAAVEKACRGIDVVFHEAALPSVQRSIADPKETLDVNVGGTVNVLLGSKKAKVSKVLIASSSSIYGNAEVQPVSESVIPNPISPYGASKLASEAFGFSFTASFGLPFYALRYFNVFGPRQDPKSDYAAVVPRFIAKITNGGRPVIYGDGTQTRDFTFVGNVVSANLLVADNNVPTGAYNIAAGRPHTVKELLETLCRIFEKPYNPVFEPHRPGDIVRSSADVRKAQEHLGYRTGTDFRSGLEITSKAAKVAAGV